MCTIHVEMQQESTMQQLYAWISHKIKTHVAEAAQTWGASVIRDAMM